LSSSTGYRVSPHVAREKPYGVAANDVPLTHIICRTRPLDAPAAR
jgi:hypothetical protein